MTLGAGPGSTVKSSLVPRQAGDDRHTPHVNCDQREESRLCEEQFSLLFQPFLYATN